MSETETVLAIWQQSAQMHARLWQFYVAVVLVAAGYFCTATYARAPLVAKLLLGLILATFFSVNAWSIADNLASYNAAAAQLRELAGAGAMRPIDAGHLVGVHAVIDACVIGIAVLCGRAR